MKIALNVISVAWIAVRGSRHGGYSSWAPEYVYRAGHAIRQSLAQPLLHLRTIWFGGKRWRYTATVGKWFAPTRLK